MMRVFIAMTYSPKKPRNASWMPPIKKMAIIVGAYPARKLCQNSSLAIR